jgi:hypothetical protein
MSNFYQYPPQQGQQAGIHGNAGPGYAYQPNYQQPYNPQQQGQYQNQQGGNPQFPGQEYLGLNNVSPDVLKYGFSAGQSIIRQQTDKWMPGVSTFWLKLKYYFAVSSLVVLFVYLFSIMIFNFLGK